MYGWGDAAFLKESLAKNFKMNYANFVSAGRATPN